MKRSKLFYFTALSLTVLICLFEGCKSTDNSTGPQTGSQLSPPTNVTVSLYAASGAGATIKWTASTDQSSSNFKGYSVVTYRVDSSGNNISQKDSALVQKGDSTFHNVTLDASRTYRYRSSVYSIGNDGSRSDAATTVIYAAVYEVTSNSKIDEYSAAASAKSGFGWDPFTGLGTQYSYSSANSGLIDLHLRTSGTGLTFYSPSSPSVALTNGKQTKIALIGPGKAAYDQTENLPEPTQDNIAVSQDNVYLIKTQNNFYIKLWVRNIGMTGSNTYTTVSFDYKLQPIQGLKVLKNRL